MPVYLVAFNVHAADGTPHEAHRAELRAAGLRSIVERRFPPEQWRKLSPTSYLIDTAESMATLNAFTDDCDELYILALAGPPQGRAPAGIDIRRWLDERLSAPAQGEDVIRD